MCVYAQLCPTLCDPMDCSPPGSSVHGISQARILEWVAIFYSRESSWPRDWTCISCIGRQILYHCATWGSLQLSSVQSLSHVRLLVTLWTLDRQAPLSVELSRQEYWSGLPFPSPRDLPNPGIEPTSPLSPALVSEFFYHWVTWEAQLPDYNLFKEHICNFAWEGQVLTDILWSLTYFSRIWKELSILNKMGKKKFQVNNSPIRDGGPVGRNHGGGFLL